MESSANTTQAIIITGSSAACQPTVVIFLGRQGEHGARRIVFDISAWTQDFGAGTAELFHLRSGDTEPYAVPVQLINSQVVWDVSGTDTERICHYGGAELRYRAGNAIVKSGIFRTRVLPALKYSEESVLDPVPDSGA